MGFLVSFSNLREFMISIDYLVFLKNGFLLIPKGMSQNL